MSTLAQDFIEESSDLAEIENKILTQFAEELAQIEANHAKKVATIENEFVDVITNKPTDHAEIKEIL
jgi:hypothetical protein